VRNERLTPTRQRTFHTCQSCGTTFFIERKATGRPPKFCSRRCRNAEFRLKRTLCTGLDESAQKSVRHSSAYKSRIGDRRSPVEVLGSGRRWSNGIDRDLLRFVVDIEVGEPVIGPPAPQTAAGNLHPEIPDLSIPADLSIPPWLRRS
jgi:hypothetical protein